MIFPVMVKRPKSSVPRLMDGILGYARVSTSDQDVAGQSMRLTEAGAIKVFTLRGLLCLLDSSLLSRAS
jgi:hypothetical protein